MPIPIKKGTKILRRDGPIRLGYRGLNYAGAWLPLWNTITSRRPIGTNVFEKDWDLLVVLDAARVDILRGAAETTPWLGPINSMRSVGSMSAEWVANTFTESYSHAIEDTAIVSGNGWSDFILNERYHEHREHDYEYLYPGYTDWKVVSADKTYYHELVLSSNRDELNLHPESIRIPHVLTDRAIRVGRHQDCDQMIVHYNLPHLEHMAGALNWERGDSSLDELMDGPDVVRDLRPEEKSFDPGRRGEVSSGTYRRNYLQTLHFVLEYVDILLENVDAETVAITADHGEALGENGVWGHPFGYPFAPVKTVPWTTTTATDQRTYESRHDRIDSDQSDTDQRKFLRQMGYR